MDKTPCGGCRECSLCGKTEAPAKINISDAFLRKTVYAKKSLSFKGILSDSLGASLSPGADTPKQQTSPSPLYSAQMQLSPARSAVPSFSPSQQLTGRVTVGPLAGPRSEARTSAGAGGSLAAASLPQAGGFGLPAMPHHPWDVGECTSGSGKDPEPLYNPLLSTAYDISKYMQLQFTEVPCKLLLPLLSDSSDLGEQHARVNELLGLPRIHVHHEQLTRDMLKKVLAYGGLRAMDEKGFWPHMAKEVGHQPGNMGRLRMYYIIVCYAYEQLARIGQAPSSRIPQNIALVYVEPKKADILPDIVQMLVHKKKRDEVPKYVRPTQTSPPLEVACALNYMCACGISAREELVAVLSLLPSFVCTSPRARYLFSCKELQLFHFQALEIIRDWARKEAASLRSKESDGLQNTVQACVQYAGERLRQTEDLKCRHCGDGCIVRARDVCECVLQILVVCSGLCCTDSALPLLVDVFDAVWGRCPAQGLSAAEPVVGSDVFARLLVVIWNVLRAEPGMEKEQALSLHAALGSRVDAIQKTVRKVLFAPVLNRRAMRILVESAQIEAVVRILLVPGSTVIIGSGLEERLAEIWRYLLLLCSQGFFSTETSPVSQSARVVIEVLATYFHAFCGQTDPLPEKDREKRTVLETLDVSGTEWAVALFAQEGLPRAAYALLEALLPSN